MENEIFLCVIIESKETQVQWINLKTIKVFNTVHNIYINVNNMYLLLFSDYIAISSFLLVKNWRRELVVVLVYALVNSYVSCASLRGLVVYRYQRRDEMFPFLWCALPMICWKINITITLLYRYFTDYYSVHVCLFTCSLRSETHLPDSNKMLKSGLKSLPYMPCGLWK